MKREGLRAGTLLPERGNMKLRAFITVAFFVWVAVFPAHAGYNDDPFSLDPNAVPTTPGGFSGSGRSVSEREAISPIYTAAEIRLLKARLRQLEAKVAREERALKAIAKTGRVKCLEHHFKNSLSASSHRHLLIGARKSGNWPATAGRKSLSKPQHFMRCGAAARHPCKRFIWWR